MILKTVGLKKRINKINLKSQIASVVTEAIEIQKKSRKSQPEEIGETEIRVKINNNQGEEIEAIAIEMRSRISKVEEEEIEMTEILVAEGISVTEETSETEEILEIEIDKQGKYKLIQGISWKRKRWWFRSRTRQSI